MAILECIEALLEYEADVNDLTSKQWTPLHYASYNGHLEVVKFLVSKGCDPLVKNSDGKLAAEVAKIPAIQELLTNIDTSTKSSDTNGISKASSEGKTDEEWKQKEEAWQNKLTESENKLKIAEDEVAKLKQELSEKEKHWKEANELLQKKVNDLQSQSTKSQESSENTTEEKTRATRSATITAVDSSRKKSSKSGGKKRRTTVTQRVGGSLVVGAPENKKKKKVPKGKESSEGAIKTTDSKKDKRTSKSTISKSKPKEGEDEKTKRPKKVK
eukprot:TRINITY_DN10904_c0_g1_i3.p1 TRINITY_DN10904_c0_g1~~TRINITY_DN10904_c0_g1_i3.p1  ORF type:complete len:272 (-),score=85.43 TRINITY_DN10904_c0_g1_i3:21-836(-)